MLYGALLAHTAAESQAGVGRKATIMVVTGTRASLCLRCCFATLAARRYCTALRVMLQLSLVAWEGMRDGDRQTGSRRRVGRRQNQRRKAAFSGNRQNRTARYSEVDMLGNAKGCSTHARLRARWEVGRADGSRCAGVKCVRAGVCVCVRMREVWRRVYRKCLQYVDIYLSNAPSVLRQEVVNEAHATCWRIMVRKGP